MSERTDPSSVDTAARPGGPQSRPGGPSPTRADRIMGRGRGGQGAPGPGAGADSSQPPAQRAVNVPSGNPAAGAADAGQATPPRNGARPSDGWGRVSKDVHRGGVEDETPTRVNPVTPAPSAAPSAPTSTAPTRNAPAPSAPAPERAVPERAAGRLDRSGASAAGSGPGGPGQGSAAASAASTGAAAATVGAAAATTSGSAPARAEGSPTDDRSFSRADDRAGSDRAGSDRGAGADAEPTTPIARPERLGEPESAAEQTQVGPGALQAVAPAGAAEKAKPVARTSGGERSRKSRRARLRLSRIDPWSVMKTSFLFSIALGIAAWVAVAFVWWVIQQSGLIDQINIIAASFSPPGDADPFRIEAYINGPRLLGLTALLAVVDVFLITAISTVASFLYNLSAVMLGGLQVTLAETED